MGRDESRDYFKIKENQKQLIEDGISMAAYQAADQALLSGNNLTDAGQINALERSVQLYVKIKGATNLSCVVIPPQE
jgi:hypothetical protein